MCRGNRSFASVSNISLLKGYRLMFAVVDLIVSRYLSLRDPDGPYRMFEASGLSVCFTASGSSFSTLRLIEAVTKQPNDPKSS